MNKKGFTLVELLAVIAILAILVIVALPNVIELFNSAKKNTFETEVKTVFTTAEQEWISDTFSSSKNRVYSRCKDAVCGKELKLDSKDNLEYYIEFNGLGKIIKYYITDGTYQYQYEDTVGLKKEEISNIEFVPDLDETEIVNISKIYEIANKKYLCKRATTLHEDYCDANAANTYYFCKGSGLYHQNFTYGSLGTNGELNPGDAFDCDVNDDGIYDSATERFYYISPRDADTSSDYVTMIYYSNVSNGVPDNLSSYSYGNATNGPTTALIHLPSTSQWKNNMLVSNMTRQIKNHYNGTTTKNDGDIYNLPLFTYTDRAARLLTLKELKYACGNGDDEYYGYLDNCKYLMENTKYSTNDNNTTGYWLETWSSNNNFVRITFVLRNITYESPSDSYRNGIRPAIEVLKSDIKY